MTKKSLNAFEASALGIIACIPFEDHTLLLKKLKGKSKKIALAIIDNDKSNTIAQNILKWAKF